MFTVLWKRQDISYEEVLPEVRKVWLRGKGTYEDPNKQTVGVEFVNGDTTVFEEGSVFVMNENGRTVATYHPAEKPEIG